MKVISRKSTFIIVLTILLILTSCVDSKTLLNAELDTFPHPNSTLLYEYSAIASSASGDCIGTFLDRWYGTSMSIEDMAQLISRLLSENGWNGSEEVVEIWSKKNEDGVFRISPNIFADSSSISQDRGAYKLPAAVLKEFTQHKTIYLLSMVHVRPRVAEKCFGD